MSDGKYAHEMIVGDHYVPLVFTVTPSMNEQYLFSIQDYHARYWTQADGRPALVHPVLLLQMTPRTRSPSWKLAAGMGSVLGQEKTEFVSCGLVGEHFRVEWTILDVYEKRGRPYHNTETRMYGGDERLIMRRELHSTFFMRDGKAAKEGS
jgi:hypothetical protein